MKPKRDLDTELISAGEAELSRIEEQQYMLGEQAAMLRRTIAELRARTYDDASPARRRPPHGDRPPAMPRP